MDKPETIDLVRLGHKIRFLRQGKGWSLADLDKESGVSKAYISDIENGVAGKPNIQYVFSIAKALGVTLNELVHETMQDRRSATGSRKEKPDLPPGLMDLQQELNLTDEDVQMLGTVNFRGHRPKDKEGWRFLLETIRMLSGRKPLT
jgi:transcriptional regulator with XRE-family HTH domain